MASPFDSSKRVDPTDNMVASKSTLKRSISFEENENESSKKLATEDVKNVESVFPLDEDSHKVNVDDLQMPLVHEQDDDKGDDENVDKSNKSSEKLAMKNEINIKTLYPLIEDNNKMNVNEPEATIEPNAYEEDDKIDSDVNLKMLSESSEKFAMVDKISIFHPLVEDNNNMNMNEPATPNELNVSEEDNKIDDGANSDKFRDSSEKLTVEDELNIQKSDEGNTNIKVNEQKLNKDDKMKDNEDDFEDINDDDEIEINDDDKIENNEDDEMESDEEDEMENYEDEEMEINEDDETETDDDDEMGSEENPEQTENDHISIHSSSSEEEKESSKLDSDEENETPENRMAKEEFRKKRREHNKKEYNVARFLVNQMRDVNDESSEDDVVVIHDSNDEHDDDNNQPNLSNTV